MIEIGRICLKIAGRDAGGKCVILDILDDNFVLVDGQVRRKKCNMKHIEPLDQKTEISKNAPHAEVVKTLKGIGIDVIDSKRKESKPRPISKRKASKTPVAAESKENKSRPKTPTKKK